MTTHAPQRFNPANLPDGLESAVTDVTECGKLIHEAVNEMEPCWDSTDITAREAFSCRIGYLADLMLEHVRQLRRTVYGPEREDDGEAMAGRATP